MPFPDRFLEELIERNDIVGVVSSYVQLSNKGFNMFGLCPFHNEKTPSFSVSQSKQIYYCFGCGKGGGVINFIMEIENLSYPDAIHFLANRVGMTVPEDDTNFPKQRRRILDLNREAARFFNSVLKDPQGEGALAYMEKRGIKMSTATRFGLGAAPDSWDALIRAMSVKGYEKSELIDAGLAVAGRSDSRRKGSLYDKFRNRLMFPVIDLRGEVVGFGGRSLDSSEPKYLNSPETIVFSKRKILFGLNLAKNTKHRNIILCEGNIDVVTLHQAGFDNAVASMGTALTVEQTRLIARYAKEIIICFDSDEAGKKATSRALDILKNSEFTVKVLTLPSRMEDGKAVKIDADDFIRIHGADAFEKLLSGSENHVEYGLLNLRNEYDLDVAEQKVEYLKRASELIAKLSSPVEREIFGARAAESANISYDSVALEISRAIKRQNTARKKSEQRNEERPAVLVQPKEKGIKYENIRSARAEEGIIRLVLLDPKLISSIYIDFEEFSSPFLGKVYSVIKSKYEAGSVIALPALAGELTPTEMSGLTAVIQKPESLSDPMRSINDYIAVIRSEKLKGSDDLLAISEKLRESKGYGG